MAISRNWNTKTFSIPQADLTLVTGTLYDMNTETDFRQEINAIMASEEGIVFEDPIDHNTTYTVAGTTYARKIEVINGYSVTFTPDSQWSVRLSGSNNNLFDVENGILNQNQVQVIPNNSAGQQVISIGSGLSAAQDSKLTAINDELVQIEGAHGHSEYMRLMAAVLIGKMTYVNHGNGTYTITYRNMGDTKDRASNDGPITGGRTSSTMDLSE